MLRGRCFPLPTSARRTCGGECGSSPSTPKETFPTPLAAEAIRARFKPQVLARAFLKRDWKGMLAEYVAAFPLPPETPEELAQRQTSRGLRELRAAILFPTPMTQGLRGGSSALRHLKKMLAAWMLCRMGGGIRRRAAGLGSRRGGIRGGDARGAREKLRGRDSAGAERAGTRDRRFARAREKLTQAFACVPAAPRA